MGLPSRLAIMGFTAGTKGDWFGPARGGTYIFDSLAMYVIDFNLYIRVRNFLPQRIQSWVYRFEKFLSGVEC